MNIAILREFDKGLSVQIDGFPVLGGGPYGQVIVQNQIDRDTAKEIMKRLNAAFPNLDGETGS